ncbi:hypothetical protein EPUL_005611, partial [Erysiphe pulchra]
FTLVYQLLILVAALACCTLSHAYIESYKDNREELYILMLSSVAGAMLMVASSHYASFFISLELMSIPVYGLLAYTHQRIALIIFAVAFKLSLAPFHKWTPDVYAGAPAPIATFLATAAKVATIGLLGNVTVYVITYVLTTIGAFGAVALMSSPYNNTSEAESLAEYRGLFWRRPVLTAVLTVMMLSLAGIPLTAGFIGKFLIVMAAVTTQHWFLAAMIIVGSGIGLYYYLRVMVVMYMTPPETPKMDAVDHWGQRVGGIMVLLD